MFTEQIPCLSRRRMSGVCAVGWIGAISFQSTPDSQL